MNRATPIPGSGSNIEFFLGLWILSWDSMLVSPMVLVLKLESRAQAHRARTDLFDSVDSLI